MGSSVINVDCIDFSYCGLTLLLCAIDHTHLCPLCTQVVCCSSVVVTLSNVVFFGDQCSKLKSKICIVTLLEKLQNPIQRFSF